MAREPELFQQLSRLATEQRNPASMRIDTASVREILEIINAEDHRVPEAVKTELPWIEEAVKIIVAAFNDGGRLFYAGAGTSGRLGILDASECPPTFGTDPELVQGLIAGGKPAVFQAQEGAEDLESNGKDALEEAGVTEKDVVCGIAASRRTPFVVGAVRHARSIGCRTLFVTCTPRASFDIDVDVAICPVVGPEVVMGSTRMKSGTAQKLVLNMLTTASMIRMGKVYENMMVDLQMTNAKLVERSKRTVMTVTGLDYGQAGDLLDRADGHVKTALVMHLADVGADEARSRLDSASGFVRPAIENSTYRPTV
ncbi:MAG: N-acetylmuramic acid 6-phosphate etherase [Rhodothermales bacterium]|nr:N-acetylmuramic acid 6-phosphate etherase [Rhodothermales bacterium]